MEHPNYMELLEAAVSDLESALGYLDPLADDAYAEVLGALNNIGAATGIGFAEPGQ